MSGWRPRSACCCRFCRGGKGSCHRKGSACSPCISVRAWVAGRTTVRSLTQPLCVSGLAADGFRACTSEHAIENGSADGNFRLLCAERSSAQAVSYDRFVATDGGLDQRTLAIASRSLPIHSAMRLDRRDMTIPLTGNLCIRAADRVGPRWNDDGSIGAVPTPSVSEPMLASPLFGAVAGRTLLPTSGWSRLPDRNSAAGRRVFSASVPPRMTALLPTPTASGCPAGEDRPHTPASSSP
ncbi:hypothetical protein EV665_1289 [Shinella granuli]|uniref:Uncharacterized protein n=1 Tax=Shinella granuli TaxID=323621 RepID=A0A4R2C9C7_SHIGR|nr:hypothetical protein EV665_1289 [Shinella granuli]